MVDKVQAEIYQQRLGRACMHTRILSLTNTHSHTQSIILHFVYFSTEKHLQSSGVTRNHGSHIYYVPCLAGSWGYMHGSGSGLHCLLLNTALDSLIPALNVSRSIFKTKRKMTTAWPKKVQKDDPFCYTPSCRLGKEQWMWTNISPGHVSQLSSMKEPWLGARYFLTSFHCNIQSLLRSHL